MRATRRPLSARPSATTSSKSFTVFGVSPRGLHPPAGTGCHGDAKGHPDTCAPDTSALPWRRCKCRACTFCPKGSDAIEQAAADDSPPPPSPPPLSGQGGSGVSPSLLLGAVAADVSGSTSSTEAGPAVQGLAAGGDVAAAGAAAEPGANEEAAANAALDALPARPTSAASPLAASSPRTGPDGEAANQKLGEVAPSAASAGEQVAQLSSGDAPSSGLGDAAAEAGISAGATGTVGAGGGAADVPGAAGSSAAGMVAGGAHGVAGASEPSEREEPGLTGGEADVGADADALMDAVDGASYAGEGEEEEGGVGLGGADVSGEAAPQREAAQGEGGPDVPPAGGAANGADASSAGAAGGGGAAAVGDVAPDQGLTAGMSGESEAAEEAMEAGGAMAVD